ncbi:hypothetical protein CDIK_0162 [Cucumispora dikerogammari]|nr:hypothetical protein CDIK_0162 [Cucumispora dikerogammari]
MKIPLLPFKNFESYKYRVHEGPFLGIQGSILKGTSFKEALVFEEGVLNLQDSTSKSRRFNSTNDLLKEFVVDRLDMFHVRIKNRSDNTCLTYDSESNVFVEFFCNFYDHQIFTEIPYQLVKPKYENLFKKLLEKNRILMHIKMNKDSGNFNSDGFKNGRNKSLGPEIDKNKSEAIKRDVIDNYLKRSGLQDEEAAEKSERSIPRSLSNSEVFEDLYFRNILDNEIKKIVADKVETIENFLMARQALDELGSYSMIKTFKEKHSELIPHTLEVLENV